jgi:broad specificity phosphatase PhoE
VREKFAVSPFLWLHQFDSGAIPNAEDRLHYRNRVDGCLQHILKQNANQTAAVFCHGGVIRMLLALMLELPLPKMASFEIDYASVTHVEIHPHKTEVQFLNFAPWQHTNL